MWMLWVLAFSAEHCPSRRRDVTPAGDRCGGTEWKSHAGQLAGASARPMSPALWRISAM
jgi:hypothetical protein